jgi:hypothetical protein
MTIPLTEAELSQLLLDVAVVVPVIAVKLPATADRFKAQIPQLVAELRKARGTPEPAVVSKGKIFRCGSSSGA